MKAIVALLGAAFTAVALAAHAAQVNVAKDGIVSVNAPLFSGYRIGQLNNGNTNDTAHGDVGLPAGFAYLLDLGATQSVVQIRLYPRQDGCCPDRLTDFRVSVHGDDGTGNPGAEAWGGDLFTDGSNPGSTAGSLVVVMPPAPAAGRFVQIRSLADPVPDYALQMTEIEVIAELPADAPLNRATTALVTANRPLWPGTAPAFLVDGDRTTYVHGNEDIEAGFAYTINLGVEVTMDRIVLWARQDGCCPDRLTNYRVSVHPDNGGQPGTAVWQADRFTDFTNPGSDSYSRDILTAGLHAAGQFKGQWVQITSLDNPPANYALQLSDLEVFGAIPAGTSFLLTQQPQDVSTGPGQTATFTVAASVINGDPALLTYQWQRNETNLAGATNAAYTTAPLKNEDLGARLRCVVSYPGLPSQTSDAATIGPFNYAAGAPAYSNRPLWAGGGWNIALLTDGNRGVVFHGDTAIEAGFAYEVRLPVEIAIARLELWARQDGCCSGRFANYRVSIHADNAGQIGDPVWQADRFTDGTDPGSFVGARDVLTNALDSAGVFTGQWVRIVSLEDPVPDYALQMTELEVYGSPTSTAKIILITRQPQNAGGAPARTATFTVAANVVNGDVTQLTYQWQRNGTNITGATTNTYTTGPLADADNGAKFRCVVSCPDALSVTSDEATLTFDYNYARGSAASSSQPLWIPGGWSVAMLVDGDRLGVFHGHENIAPGFAYEVNLGAPVEIERIDIFPRQDPCCPERLTSFRVSVHSDTNGAIGEVVWSADLFTDGANPGSGPGTLVTVTNALDPDGAFEGQWVRLLSLEDPVPNYALQMTELEVIGRLLADDRPVLTITRLGGDIRIGWTAGTLESTDALGGTWVPVGNAVNPYTTPATGSTRFFRARQ